MCDYLGMDRTQDVCDSWGLRDAIVRLKQRVVAERMDDQTFGKAAAYDEVLRMLKHEHIAFETLQNAGCRMGVQNVEFLISGMMMKVQARRDAITEKDPDHA